MTAPKAERGAWGFETGKRCGNQRICEDTCMWKNKTEKKQQTMGSGEVLKISIQKNDRAYSRFLILIAALEVCMMIYGIVFFDFGDPRHRAYFGAYVTLLCCTAAAFIINRICQKDGKRLDLAGKNACAYSVMLVFWSAFVSGLETSGGGYPVTYMTILAAVGGAVALNPILYIGITVLSALCMFWMVFLGGRTDMPRAFYVNCVIFLLVMAAVEYRNYRSAREQYVLNRKLEEWAELDALTRISNRRAMDRYFEKLGREGRTYTLALVDVNHFKGINDTYGHKEGDQCLIEIAGLLADLFGAGAFRCGGDEFAIVSFEPAELVAEKMNVVNERLTRKEREYALSVCAGIYCSGVGDDERNVFERADQALYSAKRKDVPGVVLYQPEGKADRATER